MSDIIIALILGLLLGYNIGFIRGGKTSREEMFNSMPLILKEESLIKGYCIICNKGKKLTEYER